jgi:hypothetical protein
VDTRYAPKIVARRSCGGYILCVCYSATVLLNCHCSPGEARRDLSGRCPYLHIYGLDSLSFNLILPFSHLYTYTPSLVWCTLPYTIIICFEVLLLVDISRTVLLCIASTTSRPLPSRLRPSILSRSATGHWPPITLDWEYNQQSLSRGSQE